MQSTVCLPQPRVKRILKAGACFKSAAHLWKSSGKFPTRNSDRRGEEGIRGRRPSVCLSKQHFVRTQRKWPAPPRPRRVTRSLSMAPLTWAYVTNLSFTLPSALSPSPRGSNSYFISFPSGLTFSLCHARQEPVSPLPPPPTRLLRAQ